MPKIVKSYPRPTLNYNFYTRFADIVECNKSNLKMVLCSSSDEIVLTKDEARLVHEDQKFESTFFHEILYWKGYDSAYSLSKTSLLQLNDRILENIITYLHGNDLHAFYRTCKHSKQLVKQYLSENTFYSSADTTKLIHENVFKDLGEHILQMVIDFVDFNELDLDYWLDEGYLYQGRI